MKYVKHFDILGVDTAQIPCIELQGAPNAATVGAVGLLGMDMTSEGHEIYKCVAVNGSVYTWECIVRGKDGTCVKKADIIDGELIFTLSDGSTINAGKVKGADGKDGLNGKDGKDGCEITNITISDKNELLVETSDGKVINAGVLPTVKGDAGVSVVKAEFNNKGELVLTLSSGELLTVGHVIPTLQDWLGTEPIGDDTHYIYYDGEKFVTRAVNISDETTEWAQIALMADQISKGEKTPEELGLAVGQEKTITLTTGEEVTFVILGFNHDDLADGSGKAGITFGMKGLLSTKYVVSDATHTPYSEWIIRDTLTEIYDTLPPDLRVIIKDVTKLSKHHNGVANSIDTTVNKLFLFSISEVWNTWQGDGSRYEYYESGLGSTKKFLNNGYGSASEWGLRSRYYSGGSGVSTWIFAIDSDGNATSVGLGNGTSSGICFGFCV